MYRVSVELALRANGLEPVQGSFEEQVSAKPAAAGAQYFMEESTALLRQEILYSGYLEELPQVEDLFPEQKQMSFKAEDLFTGTRENVMNKRELWRFVGNSALGVRLWLAKSRAFRDVQRSLPATSERLRWVLHHEKMDKLHHAVHGIANLRDLPVRIVAEALGYDEFVARVPKGKRSKKTTLRHLGAVLRFRSQFEPLHEMSKEDYSALQEIARRLETSATPDTNRFLEYRHRLVHREPPIVDEPGLYPQLEGRAWRPIIRDGKQVGKQESIPARGSSPKLTFEDLYPVVVAAFKHYVETLRKLRSISVFSP